MTLAVSLVILMLSTLVTFNVSRAILMGQKIVNNDARAKQAFEAAEAGVTAALDYLEEEPDRNGTDDDCAEPGDSAIDCIFDTNSDAVGDTNTAAIGGGSVTLAVTDLSGGDMTTIKIVAVGLSDDASASRKITRTLTTVDPLPNAPEYPVVVRGGMTLSGSATVHNPEGHGTIWAGAGIDLGDNSGTATEVPDTGAADYPGCLDIPGTCGLLKASSGSMKGFDIIENDSSLNRLTSAEFFRNFFGMSPAGYRNSMVTTDTTSGYANRDADLAAHEVIWIEGNVTFYGITVGCTTSQAGSNVCPDAQTKPCIVIVNGNASFSGTSRFYGILFVTGNVTVSGNTTVRGAMVTAGNAASSTGGRLDVWYDPALLEGTSPAGPLTGAAGTWKDF